MPRFSNGYTNPEQKENFSPINNGSEETFLGNIKFGNPSEISLDTEKDFDSDKLSQFEIPKPDTEKETSFYEENFDEKYQEVRKNNKNLLDYVERLGRDNTLSFYFDLSLSGSSEEKKSIIDEALEKGNIFPEERDVMYGILGLPIPEYSDEEKINKSDKEDIEEPAQSFLQDNGSEKTFEQMYKEAVGEGINSEELEKVEKGKSFKDIRIDILDYIETNLPKTDDIHTLHYGIDLARSVIEIKRELDDAFKNNLINSDQKDLMYHLAGLTENNELNKLSQFNAPVLSEGDTKESERSFASADTRESSRGFLEDTKESSREFTSEDKSEFKIPVKKPKFEEEETKESERFFPGEEDKEESSYLKSLDNLKGNVSSEVTKTKEKLVSKDDYDLEINVPSLNRGPYKVGSTASVLRTNGEIDKDWIIADISDNRVYLMKGEGKGFINKSVEIKDFIKEQILANSSNGDYNKLEISKSEDLNNKKEIINPTEIISNKPEVKIEEKESVVVDIKPEKAEDIPPRVVGADGIKADNFDELFIKAEEIYKKLESARDAYASAYVNFKNEHREKKSKFAKVMADLGMDKQMPKSDEIPEELKELERAYIEAKKEKKGYLIAKKIKKEKVVGMNTITAKVEDVWTNEELVNDLMEEYERFNHQIQESLSPLEKGIIGKSLEKWQNINLPTRIILSTSLMTGIALSAGFVPLAGAVAYGGYRVARAGASAIAGQLAGKGIQMKFDRNNKERKEGFLEEYGENITEENFAEKEKRAREFFESEQERKKRQTLGKAVAMASVAGGAGLLSSIDSVGTGNGGGSTSIENPPKVSTTNIVDTTKVPVTEIPKPEEIEVELSSKGFIKTFDDMRDKLIEKYGSVDKIPTNLKHFASTSSIDLAKEFGMYDPDRDLSASGLKGESLSLDDKGNLKYEHLDGREDMLFDGKRGEAYDFEGKLINSRGEVVPKEYVGEKAPFESNLENKRVAVENPMESNDSKSTVDKAENPQAKNNIFEIKGKPFAFPNDFEYKGHKIEVGDLGDKKVLVFDGEAIAQSVENPEGGFYPMILAEKLQDGDNYKEIREAYVSAQEEMTKGYKGPIAKLPFEGGSLHVVSADESGSIKILLNGKEIAKGLLNKDKIEVLLDKELKSGWFSSKTVYERAIEFANKNELFETIQTLLAKK